MLFVVRSASKWSRGKGEEVYLCVVSLLLVYFFLFSKNKWLVEACLLLQITFYVFFAFGRSVMSAITRTLGRGI